MRGISEEDLAAYLDTYLARAQLQNQFFRAIIISVKVYSRGGFLCRIIRNGDITSDQGDYLCVTPGYVPQVGDDVECMYRDKGTAWILWPIRLSAVAAYKTGLLNPRFSGYIGSWTTLGAPTGGPFLAGEWGYDSRDNVWRCSVSGYNPASSGQPVATFVPVGLHNLDSQTPSGVGTITFVNPIPVGYSTLIIEWYGRSSVASTTDFFYLRFNNDAAANYDDDYVQFSGTAAPTTAEHLGGTGIIAGIPTGNNATTDFFASGEIKIKRLEGVVGNKIALFECFYGISNLTTDQKNIKGGGKWRTTATVINRIDIVMNSGNWVAGSWAKLLAR